MTVAAMPTPQISGAQADLSATTLLAAVAGASAAVALRAEDPIAEARAVRQLRPARVAALVALLMAGSLLLTTSWNGADLGAVRTYLFFAACSLLLTRAWGIPTAAVALAGYTGACLFAGVPVEGRPAWWAIPMQSVDQMRPVILAAAAALAVAVLVTWQPVLPPGYRPLARGA